MKSIGSWKWTGAALTCLVISACSELDITASDSALAFEQVPCGEVVTREVVLKNGLERPVAFSATLSGDRFAIDELTGTLAANTELAVPVRASFPTDSVAGAKEEGRLVFAFDDEKRTSIEVALVASSSGATLEFSPSAGEFGDVAFLGEEMERTFFLRNIGNAEAQVILSEPEDKQFTFDYERSPAVVRLAPGEERKNFRVQFTPGGEEGAFSDLVSLRVEGAACGGVDKIPLSATVRPPPAPEELTFEPRVLDFGLVSCGEQAEPREIVFTNEGTEEFVLSPSLAKGEESFYTIEMEPASGRVAGGQEVVVRLLPSVVPGISDVTPNLYGDTLVVETNIPDDEPREIPIRQTAKGVIVAPWPTVLSFGTVRLNTEGMARIVMNNLGNASVFVDFDMNDGGGVFSLPERTEILGNNSAVIKGAFRPRLEGELTTKAFVKLTPEPGAVFCAEAPKTSIQLSGKGSEEVVVTGAPETLPFGEIACGQAAASRAFQLTNDSVELLQLTYELRRGSASPFQIEGVESLAAGTMGEVRVVPQAIPMSASLIPDAYGDVLTVRAKGVSVDETKVVLLRQSAEGSILSFDQASLSFKRLAPLGSAPEKGFVLRNVGNRPAAVALELDPDGSAFSFNLSAETIPAGGDVYGSVTFNGVSSAKAKLKIVTESPLCDPQPAPLELIGAWGI